MINCFKWPTPHKKTHPPNLFLKKNKQTIKGLFEKHKLQTTKHMLLALCFCEMTATTDEHTFSIAILSAVLDLITTYFSQLNCQ